MGRRFHQSGLSSKPEELPTDKETLTSEVQPQTNHFKGTTTTEYSENTERGNLDLILIVIFLHPREGQVIRSRLRGVALRPSWAR